MGIRVRGLKKAKGPAPDPLPEPTGRLKGLPSDDVYLLAETALMASQQRLSEFRKVSPGTKAGVLVLLRGEVETALQAVYELSRRV
jgi:hypothetical protein